MKKIHALYKLKFKLIELLLHLEPHRYNSFFIIYFIVFYSKNIYKPGKAIVYTRFYKIQYNHAYNA